MSKFITQRGDFKRTTNYFKKLLNDIKNVSLLNKYGRKGVEILSAVTPKDSGKTSKSWSYEIVEENERMIVRFNNSNMAGDVPVAILLQYGHGTGSGGYVEGIDYINPALKPIFQEMADEAWKEVIRV